MIECASKVKKGKFGTNGPNPPVPFSLSLTLSLSLFLRSDETAQLLN